MDTDECLRQTPSSAVNKMPKGIINHSQLFTNEYASGVVPQAENKTMESSSFKTQAFDQLNKNISIQNGSEMRRTAKNSSFTLE